MAGYRLYFLDRGGGIQARQDFSADSDGEARIISAVLYEACGDCYRGYEVWSLARRIVPSADAARTPPLPRIDELPQELQERILVLEEGLQRSPWRVATSRSLSEACDAVRRALAGKPRTVSAAEIVRYIRAETQSEMMSFQLVEDARLVLRGSLGFTKWFDEYFAVVDDDECACGAALRQAQQIVVPEIATSPIFAGQPSLTVLRASGVASCVSTPLRGAGKDAMRGMFSIHKREVWTPQSREIDQLNHLARNVATALFDPRSPEAAMIRQHA